MRKTAKCVNSKTSPARSVPSSSLAYFTQKKTGIVRCIRIRKVDMHLNGLGSYIGKNEHARALVCFLSPLFFCRFLSRSFSPMSALTTCSVLPSSDPVSNPLAQVLTKHASDRVQSGRALYSPRTEPGV